MVSLVAVAQALQHQDGIIHGWLFNVDRRKATLQSCVFLDVFVIFVQGGGTNALQLAARQGRFEHIGCVHGALRRTCSYNGVQLIDEQDNFTLSAFDFLQGGLQALFEFPAEAGAGDHGTQIERHNAPARQDLRYIVGSNLLRQPLDDGGLADAGLPNQHRVVLGAPGEDLDHAQDLRVTPDYRVQLALTCQLGQVT